MDVTEHDPESAVPNPQHREEETASPELMRGQGLASEHAGMEPKGNLLGAILCVPAVPLLIVFSLLVFGYVLDPGFVNKYATLLGAALSLVIGVAVAFDAVKLGVSLLWGVGVFGAMIVVLPIYVYQRPKWVWRAKQLALHDVPVGRISKNRCLSCGGLVGIDDDHCYFCGESLR